MPTVDLAAKRYAQAAFELASESGNLEQWQDAVNQIAEFMSDPDVARLLENSRVPADSKQNLIATALADLPPLPLNLARLLARKGRTNLAGDIAAEFNRLTEESMGIAHARAVTAVELNDAEKEALQRRIEEQTGQKVVLETEVDPSLVGGIIVQLGDRLLDWSTKARLEALRASLVAV